MTAGGTQGEVPARCSVLAAAVGEPVEGTAPHAVAWVGIVLPGAWPRRAIDRVPEELARALERVPRVRPVLLRPVPGHPVPDVGLVLAGTVPGRAWLRTVGPDEQEAALARLVAPDGGAVALLAQGRDPGVGRRETRPAVLVCTNGARDRCCALAGRPAAALLAHRLPRERVLVWESSHLGGHRFAPTAAVLPHGVLLGGLGPDPAVLAHAVDDQLAGRHVVEGYRGRSTYPPVEQVAEAAVRRHLAVVATNAGPDDVHVDGSGPHPEDPAATLVLLRHTGGRTFRVRVKQEVTDELRPSSCEAEPSPVAVWHADVDADPQPGVWFGG
ncbi:sucrase ferredoxin [Aquipuribacter nitratireducens]|uniref:Sucrase ferredoxin n=1 Tax=Aquipuribacter nitratireducens TaxID=650104 RepID=A0ABW0GJD5_9MICO